ncbi:hypothetical protein J6590_074515 [Homalodisca vitripennis]|nr:hypothetical protein J6590_074515 [Homalodisca vitripennis]
MSAVFQDQLQQRYKGFRTWPDAPNPQTVTTLTPAGDTTQQTAYSDMSQLRFKTNYNRGTKGFGLGPMAPIRRRLPNLYYAHHIWLLTSYSNSCWTIG